MCSASGDALSGLLHAPQIAFAVTMNENRLPLHGLSSERCPLKLRSLLATCWDHDPARRPAAADVVKVLALVKEVGAGWGESTHVIVQGVVSLHMSVRTRGGMS